MNFRLQTAFGSRLLAAGEQNFNMFPSDPRPPSPAQPTPKLTNDHIYVTSRILINAPCWERSLPSKTYDMSLFPIQSQCLLYKNRIGEVSLYFYLNGKLQKPLDVLWKRHQQFRGHYISQTLTTPKFGTQKQVISEVVIAQEVNNVTSRTEMIV